MKQFGLRIYVKGAPMCADVAMWNDLDRFVITTLDGYWNTEGLLSRLRYELKARWYRQVRHDRRVDRG